jgi:transposase
MKPTSLPFSSQRPLAEEVRLLLTDAAWERIAAALAEVKSRRGAPPEQDDRTFVEAVLHLARTGEPWRDLPKAFGNWDAVYQRFRRWQQAGRWQALFASVGADLGQIAAAFFDSTVVRAHQHAAGAKKKDGSGGQEAQALGRSRGGFSTKVHLAAADERTALAVLLTPGQQGDATVFDEIQAAAAQGRDIGHGVADMAYDSDAIRWSMLRRDIAPVIPSTVNRKEAIPHDAGIYRERNRVERLVGRFKQFRRIATRYEKLAVTYLALIHLVAAVIKFG